MSTAASNQTGADQSQATGEQSAVPGGRTNQTNNLENFKVAVRLRPFTERERQRQSKRIVDIEHNTVALYNPKWPEEATKRFTFDHSYWSHDGFKRSPGGVNVPDPGHQNSDKYVDQEQVFEDLGRFLLENAIEGYNSALLAYGQTGSGKSYTVSGYGHNEGILPRFARELFAELDRRWRPPPPPPPEQLPDDQQAAGQSSGTRLEPEVAAAAVSAATANEAGRFEVYFSMIEIYNEVVRDLLAKPNAAGQKGGPAGANSIVRRGLRVREHPKRGFFVESLSSYRCSSKDEIESLIEEGQLNKSIAATSMNETSSRGHTIYEFHIRQFRPREASQTGGAGQQRWSPPATPSRETPAKARPAAETMTSSVVQLVDLAGSERMTVHMATSNNLEVVPQQQQQQQPARPRSRSGSPMFGGPSEQPAGGSAQSTARSRSVRSSATTGGNQPTATGGSMKRSAQQQQQQPQSPPQPSSASSSSSAATAAAAAAKRQQNGNLLGPNMNASQHHQQRFKESVSINQSLSALGNCIQVLSQFSQQNPAESGSSSAAKQPKIPYRDSVLTKLLNRCCLSGNSKVVLIATLSPADANYDDTHSTLRFADRAKQIRTHAVINRCVEGGGANSEGGVTALQRENERLKQMLDGRVTRSDDSSQTSNFDDSENMQENFQGPKLSSSPLPPGASSPGRKSRRDRATTVTRLRGIKQASSKQQQQVAAGGAGAKRKGQNVQMAQDNNNVDSPSGARKAQDTPAMEGSGTSGSGAKASRPSGFRGRSQTIAAPPGAKLLPGDSVSDLAAPTRGEGQMEQLVSPAEKKMREKRRGLSRLEAGSISLETEEADEEDYQEEGEQFERGQETGAREAPSEEGQNSIGAREANALTVQFGSALLDEIDLNELANIIDDENLLSPDSDDSFQQSVARAKFDENMSRQEKASILNRLLSNSNVASRLIKKQIESNIKQVAKLDRPKKAGASGKQHLRPVKRAELIGASLSSSSSAAAAAAAQRRAQNPYLSNLNPDEQLSSVITYMIEPGETIVGKDDSCCDLLIFGPGLRGRHAKITRILNQNSDEGRTQPLAGECFIEPIFAEPQADERSQLEDDSKAKQARRVALLVNGEPILERCRLSHGDRLLFGSAGYFVFIDELARVGGADGGGGEQPVTYDMAHAEVMRKMMSETENEAMIKEIKDYVHRPGTGRRERSRDHEESTATDEMGAPSRSAAAGLLGNPSPEGGTAPASDLNGQAELEGRQLNKIREEEGEHWASGRVPPSDDPDELYRGRLMADTYEFAMPIAEANAIANEMSISVTYGLKILTGEEQLEPLMQLDEVPDATAAAVAGDRELEGVGEPAGQSEDETPIGGAAQANPSNVIISSEQPPIKPETLDLPPELYVHVHLDELGLDFYWTKEKFQERRATMLEMYGAWDVGGKSGLVEYLIEQCKYQGYYMIDPFVDDIRASWLLVGHAQVSLRPLSHAAPLSGRFDVLDVNDEIVANLMIEAVPCENEPSNEGTDEAQREREWPYARRTSAEVLEEASELLDKKFVFLLRIVSCSRLVSGARRFAHLFCQYTLNRDQPTIRTKLVSVDLDAKKRSHNDNHDDGDHEEQAKDHEGDELHFEHRHFLVIERMTQDVLDFLQHGFLTIQLVGQYASKVQPNRGQQVASSSSSVANSASSKQVARSSAGSSISRSAAQPTLVSVIISSINKYRYRMEQQSAALQTLQFQQNGDYANSLGTYLANSATYRQHSNSGPSSVTSASNLYDGQPDDDDAVGLAMNGASNQENIIDMILIKRKLDRAENQLHYIKRTINIAEHHNKKHIPVRTVKKVLNSYGQELESGGGGIDEMAAEVTAQTKASEGKHSICGIQ